MSRLARLLGPHVAKSVALTGSDPFFPTGTDVAVLFETPQPAVLENLLMARIGLAAAKQQGRPSRSKGEVDGLAYRGVRSPDRSISSYVARLDGAVVVTNSLYQLGRLAEVAQGQVEVDRLAARVHLLPQPLSAGRRRRRRRWCSSATRRSAAGAARDGGSPTRAGPATAAVLAELQASQLDALVKKPGRSRARSTPICRSPTAAS